MRKKLSWHFYLALAIVLVIALVVKGYFAKKEEYAVEMADLQLMRSAIASAQLLWRESAPEEPQEYWYDAASFSLVSASGPKPAPYGGGTRRFGGAAKDFQEMTKTKFDNYSEFESYKGKLLHVVVSGEDDDLRIEVDWVAADK